MGFRVVVLVSGAGSLLQALIDAQTAGALDAEVVAVGSDRPGVAGLARAEQAGIPTFVHRLDPNGDRDAWDSQLRDLVGGFEPDLVVCAGYMKLLGPAFLARYGGQVINSHPALLPSFPGTHGARDALEYGVRITGATVILVDAGVDTGVIIDQVAVRVADDDNDQTLQERIKLNERELLTSTVRRMATRRWELEGRRFRWDGTEPTVSDGTVSDRTTSDGRYLMDGSGNDSA